jgi:hypothetical protein
MARRVESFQDEENILSFYGLKAKNKPLEHAMQ